LPSRSRRAVNSASSGCHNPTRIRAEGNWARSRLQSARAAMVEIGGSEEMQTIDGARAAACATDSAVSSFDQNTVAATPDSASTCASISAASSYLKTVLLFSVRGRN
jgi:hypothetical protein